MSDLAARLASLLCADDPRHGLFLARELGEECPIPALFVEAAELLARARLDRWEERPSWAPMYVALSSILEGNAYPDGWTWRVHELRVDWARQQLHATLVHPHPKGDEDLRTKDGRVVASRPSSFLTTETTLGVPRPSPFLSIGEILGGDVEE